MTAAAADVTASERVAADLEAAYVAGDTKITPERIQKARNDVESARLKRQAVEAAYSRAADHEARAHRGVVADGYHAEWVAYNEPKQRENVLLDRLTQTVAEAIQLIDARQELAAPNTTMTTRTEETWHAATGARAGHKSAPPSPEFYGKCGCGGSPRPRTSRWSSCLPHLHGVGSAAPSRSGVEMSRAAASFTCTP